jgi:hypothetical protein
LETTSEVAIVSRLANTKPDAIGTEVIDGVLHAIENPSSTGTERFYKRRSQQKTLHLRPDFCGFPAQLVIEQDLFSLSAPKARDAADDRVAFVGFLPAVFMTRFATKPVTCETSKQNVGHVPTMVLSGTRGPLLFQVIREGLGSAVRLGARGTVRLTFQLRLALEPECLKYRANHRWD